MAQSEEEEAKTPTTSNDIRNAVETAGSADESVNEDEEEKDDSAESEAEDDASEEEDKSGDTEEEADSAKTGKDESKGDDDDAKSKDDKDSGYRYTQFAGDGKPETYIGNLEKAYEESSAEGIRLNNELKMSTQRVNAIVDAVKGDKELADRLNAALAGTKSAASPGGDPEGATTDPFLVDAKSKWEQQSTKEAEEFIKANPEVVSNPEINADVKHWMEVFSAEEYRTNKRLMTAGEAMAKAYKYLGHEDKREARKSLSDAKKAAAPTRPQGSRKPAKTASDFTESQIKFGEMMGVSKEKLEKFAK